MVKYIDKDALVAEIKRRKELVSDPILLGNDLMIGERNAYFNLLSFIDSMQEEPVSEELEKVVEEIVDATVLNAYGVKEIANRLRRTMIKSVSGLDNGDMPIERWKQAVKAASNQRSYRSSKGLTETRDDYFVDGVQWADEHPKEEPASEDLEQAIDTYLATYFGGKKEKQEWPFLKKMAIHFANWQKKKNDHAIEIAHMAGEEEGKNLLKQQMLQNAITATCFGFQGAALFSFRLPSDNYLVGSERKIVLIKDEKM